MEYTKGPWHIGEGWSVKRYLYDKEGYLIADASDARSAEIAEANAKLIAKAPEMYEALKKLKDKCTDALQTTIGFSFERYQQELLTIIGEHEREARRILAEIEGDK